MSKYKCIVKVDADKFVKYHVSDLLKFTAFLDSKFSGWRWFNVYDKNQNQIANYTNNDRPRTKRI